MSWVEAVAVGFGLAAVWLSVKRNRWTWPMGLVQCALSLWVFHGAKLYSDTILYSIYVVMQFYGWVHWSSRAEADGGAVRVRRLGAGALAAWVLLIAAGSAVWGTLMKRLTDAALPYPDALIAVASLVAQWLMARRVLQSWWIWIGVDLVAPAVYAWRGLYLIAALHVVFLVMCLRGLAEWRRAIEAPEADGR